MSVQSERIPSLFGSMVFNEATMEKYVSPSAMKGWRECLQNNRQLSLDIASDIAEGMKTWALEHGATHYTHWFQPLTGITAEKHDSFINPTSGGRVIMEFSGKALVCGEPDASSFPSGGLRATFEARGYSAWDPTSFAFIKDGSLCIPTVFCSFGGEALDKKTPLLRSMDAVNRQALRILKLFGDDDVTRVTTQIGPEQEYFLVDKNVYAKREDLRLCGRTLFGAKPPRGQELDDHYFGAIRPRVAAYMKELDEELWKHGILSKTKHNEVAPSQHEMAPIYSDANSANDANQLTMEIMKKVADHHDLVCLLHEKPFAHVNGSGKHVNYSLSTNTGDNLFSPGKTPSHNARFLLFLAAFVSGVDEYQELLRCTVAHAGNDHRLGAQEAPPAVLSVFLGQELDNVIDSIISDVEYEDTSKRVLRIGVDVLPPIPQDSTDRNRTSPVAFTGNKFEFRMPGSSQSIAGPSTILNAVVADELCQFADILEKADDFQSALRTLLKDVFTKHRRILFSGNGYDDSWVEEAKKRGLQNLHSTAEALPTYILPKNIALLTKHGIYSKEEIMARHEIHMEKYCKVINIEASTLIDMVRREILGAVSRYSSVLLETLHRKRELLPDATGSMEEALVEALHVRSKELLEKSQDLATSIAKYSPACGTEECLIVYHDVVAKQMEDVRMIIDELENLVDKSYWPYPTYVDLLFSV